MCDNAPLLREYRNKLRMPEDAFKSESETTIVTCREILQQRFLEFEEIAQEIVESFGEMTPGRFLNNLNNS